MFHRVKCGWRLLPGLCVAAVVFAPLQSARACDTPVYRYAMYRWLPAPYEVYYFHEEKLDNDATKVKEAIDKVSEAEEKRANVVFIPVDLTKDKDLTGVPPDVKERWEEQAAKNVPSYLIASPAGGRVFSGALTAEEIGTLADSPIRQKLGQLLEKGKAGVYIMLAGEDEKANQLAEKEIRGVVDAVASGKIALYSAPPIMPDDESESKAPGIEIGFVKLARDAPGEKWLVDALLAIESDLRESKEPMVFMVYGRGRALPPCVGKGIVRDNLLYEIEFITGACSCTVKEQNPGVDLLMCYNWDAAAEALSRKFGAEEGSGYQFAGDALFPELIIPPDQAQPETGAMGAEAASDAAQGADDTLTVATSQQESGDSVAPPSEGPPLPPAAPQEEEEEEEEAKDEAIVPASTVQSDATDSVAGEKPASRQLASNLPTPATATETSEAGSMSVFLWVGAGLAAALVVLFGATFLVLRPK